MPVGAQWESATPSSWAWNTGRPWWPDWVMSAILGPGRSSRNVSKALRFVLGPSRWVDPEAIRSSSRCCSASPALPVSAKPAAKIMAKRGFFCSTVSNMVTESPTRITARSTSPGTSRIERWQVTPSMVSRFGFTGITAAPFTSPQARILFHIAVLGLRAESEAPMITTVFGWKNRSSSTSRRAVGRPVASVDDAIVAPYLTLSSHDLGRPDDRGADVDVLDAMAVPLGRLLRRERGGGAAVRELDAMAVLQGGYCVENEGVVRPGAAQMTPSAASLSSSSSPRSSRAASTSRVCSPRRGAPAGTACSSST